MTRSNSDVGVGAADLVGDAIGIWVPGVTGAELSLSSAFTSDLGLSAFTP